MNVAPVPARREPHIDSHVTSVYCRDAGAGATAFVDMHGRTVQGGLVGPPQETVFDVHNLVESVASSGNR